MSSYKRLWTLLAVVVIITFGILGYYGKEIYRQAPPIPQQIVTESGQTLMTEDDILTGQEVWQSVGGMQLGSIWGHGAYQAPDWTADWLHRELLAWLDLNAQATFKKPYDQLTAEQQNQMQFELKQAYRKNTYDSNKGVMVVSDRRAQAISQTAEYYARLFSNDPSLATTRQHYAMKENTLVNAHERVQLSQFFFWTAWSSATERSLTGGGATYTNNWPHEPLIGNVPTTENWMWSLISIILLIAGTGLVIWVYHFFGKHDDIDPAVPAKDPISLVKLTASQKALGKYVFLVLALFVFQIFIGGLTAHYTVEGQSFYGLPLAEYIPYSLARTWHIQSALFWIATGFLTAGLFLAPIINGGKDPKYQKLGVDTLFWALVLVVVGSFIGQYLAIAGKMPLELNFWLGHQGYEFVDLGRLWQIGKFAGVAFWLVLMVRGIHGALVAKGNDKNLLILLTMSVIAIGLFYASGFMYGARTNLSIMEYWRWWIVHLWVEGFFEVFATTALAFIFVAMGLVSQRKATAASLGSAVLFMLGGIPGTFHHLYFSGTTTPIMAIGATFSALEVVPLVILGHEAWENWRLKDRAPWMRPMYWPLAFFVAVAFWNMLGAGVFGFLINPPISLYYVQGLNTTANHAHAALFGVYGFLALGFSLLVLRYLRPNMQFSDNLMKTSFYCLNIGLLLMLFTSLLPIGMIQAYASVDKGLWYARSEAFMQSDILQTLRWVRTFGDMIFIVGGLALFVQVCKGLRNRS